MASLSQIYRVYYVALDYTSGLADVQLKIIKPDGNQEGYFIMSELGTQGIYYYDYTPDQVGQYLFTADSVSVPLKHSHSIEVIISTALPVADFES